MILNSKILLKNVKFLLLLLKMCVVLGQQELPKKIVVIDVGHGGKDSGAVGINGILEKDVVLEIAHELVRLNETVLESRFDVYLTRYRDSLISLTDRSRLAKVLKANVFVSLHCNASEFKSRGVEVYVHNSDKSNIEESIALGLSVLNESSQKLGFKKRDVKFADFQVLRETTSFCLAILIEIGFVTHPDEAVYFFKPKNIRAVALAILMGMYNYINFEL